MQIWPGKKIGKVMFHDIVFSMSTFYLLPSISFTKTCNCIDINWLFIHIWIDWPWIKTLDGDIIKKYE